MALKSSVSPGPAEGRGTAPLAEGRGAPLADGRGTADDGREPGGGGGGASVPDRRGPSAVGVVSIRPSIGGGAARLAGRPARSRSAVRGRPAVMGREEGVGGGL